MIRLRVRDVRRLLAETNASDTRRAHTLSDSERTVVEFDWSCSQNSESFVNIVPLPVDVIDDLIAQNADDPGQLMDLFVELLGAEMSDDGRLDPYHGRVEDWARENGIPYRRIVVKEDW